MDNAVYQIVVGVLLSWQMKTIVGLVLVDLVLGVAAALRTGSFDFGKVANFYKTNVLPYILGYVVLYLAITFIIPAQGLGGFEEEINDALVLVAWGTLVASLGNSIVAKLRALYRPTPAPSDTVTVSGEELDVESTTTVQVRDE